MQNAARHPLQRARALADLVDLVQNALAPRINQRPNLGDVEASRRAVQKLRAKPILKRTDVLAHCRLRQMQLPRGTGEALLRHDFCEDSHAVDAIQVCLPRFITLRDQSYADRLP